MTPTPTGVGTTRRNGTTTRVAAIGTSQTSMSRRSIRYLIALRDGTENTDDCRAPRSGRTAFSAARPPNPVRSGSPIGMSTAMIAGASGADRTSAKCGTIRSRTSSLFARTKAAIHPAGHPSTPASQMSLASFMGAHAGIAGASPLGFA